MLELETIDMNSNLCLFQYKIEYTNDEVCFSVFSNPVDPMRWFSFTFRILNDNIAKGEMMTNNGFIEFSKKGIPEKIIQIASASLERKIISSSIIPKAGDFLVGPSYKVWERLVTNNENAILNELENRFELNYKYFNKHTK
jgi:hypothetical protein